MIGPTDLLQKVNIRKYTTFGVGINEDGERKSKKNNWLNTLDAGLLARSQYSESPATGHHDTCFSWFPCV